MAETFGAVAASIGLLHLAKKIYGVVTEVTALKEECDLIAIEVQKTAELIDEIFERRRKRGDEGGFEKEYEQFKRELDEILNRLNSAVPRSSKRLIKRAQNWGKTFVSSEALKTMLERAHKKLTAAYTKWQMRAQDKLDETATQTLKSVQTQAEWMKRVDSKLEQMMSRTTQNVEKTYVKALEELERTHQPNAGQSKDTKAEHVSFLSETTKNTLLELKTFFEDDKGFPSSLLAPFSHATDLIDNPPQPDSHLSVEEAAQACLALVKDVRNQDSKESEHVRLGIRLLEATRTLSIHLFDMGEFLESHHVEEWVLRLCEALVKQRPDVFLDDLARCEEALSQRHAALGETEEACLHAMHAMSVWRDVVDAEGPGTQSVANISELDGVMIPSSPPIFMDHITLSTPPLALASPPLASPQIPRRSYKKELMQSLLMVSDQLSESKHSRMALRFAKEAVSIARKLNKQGPSEERRLCLAECLYTLHFRLWDEKLTLEALEVIEESGKITQEVWDSNETWRLESGERHIFTMETKYKALLVTFNNAEAIKVVRQVIELRRQLIDSGVDDAAEHKKSTFAYLRLLGSLLENENDDSVVDVHNLTLELAKKWQANVQDSVKDEEEDFQVEVAQSLESIGAAFAQLKKTEQMISSYKRAVTIYERISKHRPSEYLKSLATCQEKYSQSLFESDDKEKALEVARNGVEVARELASINSGPECKEFLATSLKNLCAISRKTSGTVSDEDIQLIKEASEVTKLLWDSKPAQWYTLRTSILNYQVQVYGPVIQGDTKVSQLNLEMCSANILSILDDLASCHQHEVGSLTAAVKDELIELYDGIACLFLRANELERAVKVLKSALQLSEKIKLPVHHKQVVWLAETYAWVGERYTKAEKIEQFEMAYEESLDLYRRATLAQPDWGLSFSYKLNGYAFNLHQFKKYHKAIRYAEESVMNMEKLKQPFGIACVTDTLAIIQVDIGKPALGVQSSKKSMAIVDEHIKEESYLAIAAEVAGNLASAHYVNGDLEDAAANLRRAFNFLLDAKDAKDIESRKELLFTTRNMEAIKALCERDESLKADFDLLTEKHEDDNMTAQPGDQETGGEATSNADTSSATLVTPEGEAAIDVENNDASGDDKTIAPGSEDEYYARDQLKDKYNGQKEGDESGKEGASDSEQEVKVSEEETAASRKLNDIEDSALLAGGTITV